LKEEWYSASSFKWTYRQVKWLLSWLPFIRVYGLDWVPSSKSSGYVGVKTKRKPGEKVHRSNKLYKAQWENERSILGHLENRLCKMGLDGMLVKSLYSYQESAEWLGKCLNLTDEVVKERAKLALDKLVETEKDNVRDYQRRYKE